MVFPSVANTGNFPSNPCIWSLQWFCSLFFCWTQEWSERHWILTPPCRPCWSYDVAWNGKDWASSTVLLALSPPCFPSHCLTHHVLQEPQWHCPPRSSCSQAQSQLQPFPRHVFSISFLSRHGPRAEYKTVCPVMCVVLRHYNSPKLNLAQVASRCQYLPFHFLSSSIWKQATHRQMETAYP